MNLFTQILNLQPVILKDFTQDLPFLKQLEDTEQDVRWHPEGNVLIHTQMVMDEVLKLIPEINHPERAKNIYLAALLHDIGKIYTTEKKSTGKITSYRHEVVGVSYARDILRKYVPQFGFMRREYVINLIEYHLFPHLTQLTDARLRKLSFEVDTLDLYFLSLADCMGREGIDSVLAVRQTEAFKVHTSSLGILGSFYTLPGIPPDNHLLYSLARWYLLTKKTMNLSLEEIDSLQALINLKPCAVVIPVGAPGSGKTTYLQNLYPHLHHISMDEYRKQIAGSYQDQSKNQEVWQAASSELVSCLKKRVSVVWDATSTTRKKRRNLLNLIRQQGGYVLMVYFDMPLGVLQERNLAREKQVSVIVVEKLYRELQSPKPYEYDKLLVVDEKTEFRANKVTKCP